ncbi:MAG TPA: ATP-binding protein [Thermoanaerobaculia bacterium]|nr:ATP-binding protein [Thermoanaerobaculia bacterium]
MHPLRVFLLVSLVLAVVVAWGFGSALLHAGVQKSEAFVLAAVVVVVFLLPWIGVFVWAVRRANDLDELVERTRRAAEGAEVSVTARRYYGEIDDLARSVEELRMTIARERAAHAEHRAAITEIFASLGEGLLAVSPNGRVVFANARTAEIFGHRGEWIGRLLIEVVRRQAVVNAVERALQGEATTERITVDDRYIELRTTPVAASREIAALALFIDVTTLERLERIRRDFLDDFSHEVRTPLAGVRSAAETLDAGGIAAADEQRLRQVLLRQIARIERLVKDLSDLSHIESGDIVLQKQRVDLLAIAEELIDDFAARHPANAFVVRGAASANADPARVQQILTNLLDNACKYGGPGEVLIELACEETYAVARVSDRGEGLPAGELDRVFNRFYRVDRSRSQEVPGIGLGLAIAKHLAALHGGSIRASNRPGGGATFELRLPAA